MSAPLHLVRARVDRAALATFAARAGVLDDDLGYALHLALRRRFGAAGPQPFRLLDPDRADPLLLGYASDPAGLAALPSLPDPTGDWDEESGRSAIFSTPFEAKVMPSAWATDLSLQFEVRLRPVRRHGSRLRAARAAAGITATGVEHDAFLSAVELLEREQYGRDRERVYAEWLAERLAPAARLAEARLVSFRRGRVLRSVPGEGGRGRRGRGVEGPDALMTGRLTITDGAAFAGLLARGIGRHVAFGYGMLLLRRETGPGVT